MNDKKSIINDYPINLFLSPLKLWVVCIVMKGCRQVEYMRSFLRESYIKIYLNLAKQSIRFTPIRKFWCVAWRSKLISQFPEVCPGLIYQKHFPILQKRFLEESGWQSWKIPWGFWVDNNEGALRKAQFVISFWYGSTLEQIDPSKTRDDSTQSGIIPQWLWLTVHTPWEVSSRVFEGSLKMETVSTQLWSFENELQLTKSFGGESIHACEVSRGITPCELCAESLRDQSSYARHAEKKSTKMADTMKL
jgi:hypothetical protein